MQFNGIQRIYGEQAQQLRQAHVLVVGLGGVGSWAAEALVRSGIGSLTLADPDDLCVSNINRQIHALHSTIGQRKIDVMGRRIADIAPDCRVSLFPRFVNESTINELLETPYDFVVDAIDGVMPKAGLIARCKLRGLSIVTCGGSGGKTDPTQIRVADLSQTDHDRLLAFIRKKLRRVFAFPAHGTFDVPCVFSTEPMRWPEPGECQASENPLLEEAGANLNCDGRLGALPFVTGAFGFHLAACVVNSLTEPASPRILNDTAAIP